MAGLAGAATGAGVALLLRVILATGERGERGEEGDFRARTRVLRLRGVMGGVGGRRAGWENLLLRTIDMVYICVRSLSKLVVVVCVSWWVSLFGR